MVFIEMVVACVCRDKLKLLEGSATRNYSFGESLARFRQLVRRSLTDQSRVVGGTATNAAWVITPIPKIVSNHASRTRQKPRFLTSSKTVFGLGVNCHALKLPLDVKVVDS
jgi:hypothetical protein